MIAMALVEWSAGGTGLNAERLDPEGLGVPLQLFKQLCTDPGRCRAGCTKNVASSLPSRAAVPITAPSATATKQSRSPARARSWSGVK